MKRSILLITLIVMIILAGCSNQTVKTSNNEQITQENQTAAVIQNDNVDINNFSINKITDKNSLPIAVSSIEEVLISTGNFTESNVEGEAASLQVRDVFLQLGEKQADGCYIASFDYQEMKSPKDSTELVSYHFKKSDMQTEKSEDIKWGLKTFLQLFDVELADDIWSDIQAVSAMGEDTTGMGTDYWGYGNEQKGIQLIYVNLSENVQVDIHPYGEYMGERPDTIDSLQ